MPQTSQSGKAFGGGSADAADEEDEEAGEGGVGEGRMGTPVDAGIDGPTGRSIFLHSFA